MRLLKFFFIIPLFFNVSLSQNLNSFNLQKKINAYNKDLPLSKISLLNQENSVREKIMFDSNNLHFYNSYVTWSSIGKIAAETTTGAALGYGITSFFYSKFKKIKDGGALLSVGIFYLALAALGGIYGTNLGVYAMGNIFGDEDNFWNTAFWSVIGGTVFYFASGIFT